MIDNVILGLAAYAEDHGLTESSDRTFVVNQLLEVLQLDSINLDAVPDCSPLSVLLQLLTDDAVRRNLLDDNLVARDLFDTSIMGRLTPLPREVRSHFRMLAAKDICTATDWYYSFSQDTNYIRRDRIAKDEKWKYDCEYGAIDITINLSKPEKDPRAIAAAKMLPQSEYPACALCAENEGYAGRMNHPARQNHRILPIKVAGENWFFQYSPYVYYNEHCIFLNSIHTPMKIDRGTFEKLLDIVSQFPHYFVGSNADLPIVGGSILSHDHFQGGRCVFAMEVAPIEHLLSFREYPDVKAGIVRWPMSVIRLRAADPERLCTLADRIPSAWRGYTDPESFIYAETNGEPHNTITPIARRRGADYELDLVLRNNIATKEHPLGLFHPHADLQHIKKENIGLIEVMGLAVLPSRLAVEMRALEEALLSGSDLRAYDLTAKHADWAESLKMQYDFTPQNTTDILRREIGKVFVQVLECAGVFKRTESGRTAFLRFLATISP